MHSTHRITAMEGGSESKALAYSTQCQWAHTRPTRTQRKQPTRGRLTSGAAEGVEAGAGDAQVGDAREHKRDVHAAHHALHGRGAGQRRLDLQGDVVAAVLWV